MSSSEYESELILDDEDEEIDSSKIETNQPLNNVVPNDVYGKDDSTFLENNINLIFNNDLKERVICIGEVQSGKTSNIIKAIIKAFELDYDGVIFFAGTNNVLKTQSNQRVEETLEGTGIQIIGSKEKFRIKQLLNSKSKFVINILKESKDLTEMFSCINSLSLERKKILIIDDECDYGSINTSFKNNPKLYHEKIEKLFLRIHNGKFLQVTATPFANILTTKNFSENDEFKNHNGNPIKVVVLDRYSSYCGLKVFNKHNPYIVVKGNDDIKEINDAITMFILKSIDIKLDTNQSNKKTQLLFNLSLDTSEHNDVYKKVIAYLKRAYEFSEYEINKEIERVLNEYKNSFKLNYFTNIQIYKKEFRYIVKKIIEEQSVLVLNSKNEQDKNGFAKNDSTYQLIIGGTMLSRGVTFSNLIIELMLNSPNLNCVDVLLQRCRWFGNRKNRLNYINIILNQSLKNALYYSERYLNIFKPGIADLKTLRLQIKKIDNDLSIYNVRSTNYAKSK